MKVSVSKFPLLDMVKFATLPKRREKVIKKTPVKEVSAKFKINENAAALHPDYQSLVIQEIIDHPGAGAKSFVMATKDGSPAAYFRAGQYLSVAMQFGQSQLTRPYSISSSPSWTKDGKYAITIRSNPNGYAADLALKEWKVGMEIKASDPQGQFYYDSLRDAKNVIALAGGSGITPFLSMAYAIRDGIEDFNLTILFGSRAEENILFQEQLDQIAAECPKVKIVHVLSNEQKEGFENGFITADLIKKYAPADEAYSIFICGPEAMYRFLDKEIATLGLERKYVRRELLGVTKDVSAQPGYPAECKGKTFKLTINQNGEEFTCDAPADETILCSIERAGIVAPARCRSGECGWCRSKLVSGTVFVPEETDGRRYADTVNGYIHPCATFPTSDLVLEVPTSYVK